MTDFLVQWFQSNNSVGSGVNSNGGPGEQLRHMHLPQPSGAGNFLCVFCSHTMETANPVATVTDDTSTPWTVTYVQDTGNQYQGFFAYRLNAPAGIKKIDINFSNKTAAVQTMGGEFWGIAQASALDGAIVSAVGSSQTWSPGAIVPTVANDLILSWAATCTGNILSSNTFSTSGIFSFLSTDIRYGAAAQYGVQTTATSVTPSFTAPQSATFLAIGVALKTDVSKGTPANTSTRPWIRRILWGDVNTTGTSITFQFPRSGNIVLLPTQIDLGATLSDNLGNNYIRHASGFQAGSGSVQFYHCLAPAASTQLVYTITANDLTLCTLAFYDIEFSQKLAFDVFASDATQTQTTTGPLTTVPITPSAANGIVFFQVQSNKGAFNELTNVANGYTAQEWDPAYYSYASPVSTENAVAEDSGVGHALPTSTGTLTPIWNYTTFDTLGTQQWSALAISFVPATYQKWGLESGLGAWASETGVGNWLTEASTAGGTAFVRVVSNQLNGTDAWIRKATLLRIAPNTLDGNEVRLRVAKLLRLAPNTAQVSETRLRVAVLVRNSPNTLDGSELTARRVAALRTGTDAVHPTETRTRVGTWLRRAADTTHALEVAQRAAALVRRATDALHPSELAQRVPVLVRVAASVLQGGEAVVRRVAMLRLAANTLNGSEVARRVGSFVRAASNTLNGSETRTRVASLVRAAANTLNGSEVPRRVVSAVRRATDAVHASEFTRRGMQWVRVVADAMHASETLSWVQTRLIVVFANAALHASESTKRIAVLLRQAADSLHGAEQAIRRVALLRTASNVLDGSDATRRVASLVRQSSNTAQVSDAGNRVKAWAARVVQDALHGSELTARILTRLVVVFANSALHASDAVQRVATLLRRAADQLHGNEAVLRRAAYLRQQLELAQVNEGTVRRGVWVRLASSIAHASDAALRRVAWAPRVVGEVVHASESTFRLAQRLFIIVVSSATHASEQVVRRAALVRQFANTLQASEVRLRRVVAVRVQQSVLRGTELVLRNRLMVRVVAELLNGYEALRDFLFGLIFPAKSPTNVQLLSRPTTVELLTLATDAELLTGATSVELLDTPPEIH